MKKAAPAVQFFGSGIQPAEAEGDKPAEEAAPPKPKPFGSRGRAKHSRRL